MTDHKAMPRAFCTLFDHRFLTRGLALYQSLLQCCTSFRLVILCMDNPCYDQLSKLDLPGVELVAIEDFVDHDDDLRSAKKNRSQIEYYFTCTPSLPLFVLNRSPALEEITYVDADLFFYADPRPIYDEIGDHSVALIPHRFPEKLRFMEVRGIYNVSFIYFRRDKNGLGLLKWWRNKCIEWCYDRLEAGRFADQKYLDRVPEIFEGVRIIQHKGANLAPWNVKNHEIVQASEGVLIDDQPLLFYHFHGLRQITDWLYDPNLMAYKAHLTKPLKKGIYEPYIETLTSLTSKTLSNRRTEAFHVGVRYQFENAPTLMRLWARLDQLVVLARLIISRQFILWINGRIL
jgi:hypothetical protein